MEKFEYYFLRPYQPVNTGDHFHSRYRVTHELGYGSYSTIWLAHYEPAKSHVALTVYTALMNPLIPAQWRPVSVAQLAIVVEHIHTQGSVHGDLHLGNNLLKMPSDFNRLSTGKLYEDYGALELEPVVHFDSEPLPPGPIPRHRTAMARRSK